MKIFVSDQSKRFDVLLNEHTSLSMIPYERERLRERVDTLVCTTTKRLHELDLDFLFDYRLFPENVLTSGCAWRREGRTMQVGDTILQQINIPPLQRFSLRILVATRVCEVVDLPYRKSFSYETLEGHVERVVARPYQAYCTQRALRSMQQHIDLQ
ncbi:MAG: DUF1990 family protein [Bacteroidetes bacterium]|nr:DUF1990 family protein [Bacteroidota bacterium]